MKRLKGARFKLLVVVGISAFTIGILLPRFGKQRYGGMNFDGNGLALRGLNQATEKYLRRHKVAPTSMAMLEGIPIDPEPLTDDFADHNQVFSETWLRDLCDGRAVTFFPEVLLMSPELRGERVFAFVQEKQDPGKWRVLMGGRSEKGGIRSVTRVELDELLKAASSGPAAGDVE